jgi:ribonucleotide reductase alpha subunit
MRDYSDSVGYEGGSPLEIATEAKKKRGLWENIHARRKAGKRPKRPGEKIPPFFFLFKKINIRSSVVLNSTNGIEMPMELISVKESKAGSFTQVVPEYKRLKNRYQLMWDQRDCVDYLKTAAVLAVYIDQSLSTNTFYNPAYFNEGKVPGTLIAKNLMLAYKWGIKTIYYSLINKVGSKVALQEDNVIPFVKQDIIEDDDYCESCVL